MLLSTSLWRDLWNISWSDRHPQIAQRSHWIITRVFWILNRVFQVICLMFSMFSQLTLCSSIRDGRMAQFIWFCLVLIQFLSKYKSMDAKAINILTLFNLELAHCPLSKHPSGDLSQGLFEIHAVEPHPWAWVRDIKPWILILRKYFIIFNAIHRKTMKELCARTFPGIRERPNMTQNLVTHRQW